jgi:hypothetical protein
VLLLRNIISLSGPADRPEVSTTELMSLIASRLLDTNDSGGGGGGGGGSGGKGDDDKSSGKLLPPNSAAAAAGAEAEAARRQNQEQNISDAMAVLPTLATVGGGCTSQIQLRPSGRKIERWSGWHLARDANQSVAGVLQLLSSLVP